MIKFNLNSWNFLRVLRLGIGVSTLAAYFSEYDAFIGLLGLIVTTQAVFNVGCCGTGSCTITKTDFNPIKNHSDKNKISFEEIKIKDN